MRRLISLIRAWRLRRAVGSWDGSWVIAWSGVRGKSLILPRFIAKRVAAGQPSLHSGMPIGARADGTQIVWILDKSDTEVWNRISAWDEEECLDCVCCTKEQCARKWCSSRCPCTSE